MIEVSMVTPEEIKSLVDYDPKSGIMRWKPRPDSMFSCKRIADGWNTKYAGEITAPSVCREGYSQISIFGVKYRSHRVAWAAHYGKWPEGEIDHINRIASDNRIDNLRDVRPVDNLRNKGDYKNNMSGHKGVTWHKSSGKWMAQIKVNKRNIHLGLFDDAAEAGKAYQAAKMEHWS